MPDDLSDKEFITIYRRNRALSKIMSEARVGEVDGISFDLRHKQINPDEWKMDDILGGDDGRTPTRTNRCRLFGFLGTVNLIWKS